MINKVILLFVLFGFSASILAEAEGINLVGPDGEPITEATVYVILSSPHSTKPHSELPIWRVEKNAL